jgi:hypothetical protein
VVTSTDIDKQGLSEEAYLNGMGDDGWELVAVTTSGMTSWLYLKRAKP